MDSLTHIALGACAGEAFFERGFGKKAMIWGALAQSIPDIDFIASLWMTTPEALLAHRGFTHSVLFLLLIVPVFSLIANKIHQPHNISLAKWNLFFFSEVALHLFIDAFNNYGIGWFEPFSLHRFSFNIIYVADPFFSLPVWVSFLFLMVLNKHSVKRKLFWQIGIYIPLIYLSYCCFNKLQMDKIVRQNIIASGFNVTDYFTTPAPLQNWFWYVVVKDKNGYNVGYHSLFDKSKNISFHFFINNKNYLNEVADHETLQKLIRFSKGYYTVDKRNDTLIFNDLRFGQILGWNHPRNRFVFHYYLSHKKDDGLMIQRGRMADWSASEFSIYLKKIFVY